MKLIILTLVTFISIQAVLFSTENSKKQNQIFISPVKDIKSFTFGYDDMLASLMWVRVLQDIDVCDQSKDKQSLPEFKEGKDHLSQVIERELPEAKCHEGWVYQMLDVVTDLSPQFYGAYNQGGVMLSVLVDDRVGASKIMKKGLEYYPSDWRLFYSSAYHELFEMQRPDDAAKLLKRAGELGAPKWVYSLSAKIMTRMGQAAFAKTVLEKVLDHAQGKNSPDLDRIRKQLQNVNKVLMEEAQKGNSL